MQHAEAAEHGNHTVTRPLISFPLVEDARWCQSCQTCQAGRLVRTETAVLPTVWGSTAGVGAAAEAGVLLRTTRGEGGGLVALATIACARVMVLFTRTARCTAVRDVMFTVEGTPPVSFILG